MPKCISLIVLQNIAQALRDLPCSADELGQVCSPMQKHFSRSEAFHACSSFGNGKTNHTLHSSMDGHPLATQAVYHETPQKTLGTLRPLNPKPCSTSWFQVATLGEGVADAGARPHGKASIHPKFRMQGLGFRT